ncbi:MAG: hypothetical protein AABY22_03080 [Nanoarchaeota archaeon]
MKFHKEIERRFIVNKKLITLEQLRGYPYISIKQWYPFKILGFIFRIRIEEFQYNEKHLLTIKGKNNFEFECQISKYISKFFQFGPFIEKTRSYFSYFGHTFELDIFPSRYTDYMIAEIELNSFDEEINLPIWIEKEITNQKELSNYNLAKKFYYSPLGILRKTKKNILKIG